VQRSAEAERQPVDSIDDLGLRPSRSRLGRRWRVTAAAGVLLVASGLSFGSGSLIASGEAGENAADRVTFQARPLVVSSGTRVTLFGSLAGKRAGEDVKIQAKDCGLDFFRVVSGAVTEEGGTWSLFYSLPGPSTTLRAVWNDATSAEVTIRKRAPVTLLTRPAGRLRVRTFERVFWGKRVFIQRFDARLGTWRAVKTVVLTERSLRGSAVATFTVRLPSGTRVRAVLPRSQTGPCYLPGTSNTLTT
jgi:hypothetical protein